MAARLTKAQAARLGLEEPTAAKPKSSSAARVRPGRWRLDDNPAYQVRDLGAGSSREYRDAEGYRSGIPIDRTQWLRENERQRLHINRSEPSPDHTSGE